MVMCLWCLAGLSPSVETRLPQVRLQKNISKYVPVLLHYVLDLPILVCLCGGGGMRMTMHVCSSD